MADRKSIDYKLGLRLPELYDIRTIPLRAILRLRELPPLPLEHNAHDAVGGLVDERMFGNDQYGCCVISAQAHNTLTFEKFEQNIVVPIKDQEVIDEYLRQSGGEDCGLYLSLAMKEWKNRGWDAAERHYDIYAYASVDKPDHNQVKYSIYLLNGVIFGMQVFETDMEQFRNGEPWHLTGQNGSFLGGHGVYGFSYMKTHHDCPHCLTGWDENGLNCMTWGEEQFMTWEFWDARVNQAYAIVDNRNDWLGKDSPVDVNKLDDYLEEITGGTNSGSGCLPPGLSSLLQRIKR